MMPKHPTRGLISALSTLLKRARARWMSALALYLAKPVDEFSMLTTADQQALATVLRRGDVLLSAGSTRCAELVKRLTQSR
jgi:ABC-type transport system involved in cytochrome c biogenesis permease component